MRKHTANTHRYPRLWLRAHPPDERSTMGLLVPCGHCQCLALGPDRRKVLAHHGPHGGGPGWLYHQHEHVECGWSLCGLVPPSQLICRVRSGFLPRLFNRNITIHVLIKTLLQLRRLLLLDLLVLPSASRQTCCRTRPHQRLLAAGQHRGLLRVGLVCERVSEVIWYRHCHVWCDGPWLLAVQDDPDEAEREARTWRVGRLGDEGGRGGPDGPGGGYHCERGTQHEEGIQISGIKGGQNMQTLSGSCIIQEAGNKQFQYDSASMPYPHALSVAGSTQVSFPRSML